MRKKERKKDGSFSSREKSFFEKVLPYTVSSEAANSFAENWASQEA